jgi:hypothetical protein
MNILHLFLDTKAPLHPINGETFECVISNEFNLYLEHDKGITYILLESHTKD